MAINKTSNILFAFGGILIFAAIVSPKNKSKEQTANTDEDMKTNTDLPRGYRNNNPLNIDKSSEPWEGKIIPSGDSRFEQFISMAYGYRAAFINLRTSINKYGCDTLKKIIQRWAPSNENNTSAYIQTVCKLTGFNADTYINPYSETMMTSLVYAMSIYENGTKVMPDTQAITDGWNMYVKS